MLPPSERRLSKGRITNINFFKRDWKKDIFDEDSEQFAVYDEQIKEVTPNTKISTETK